MKEKGSEMLRALALPGAAVRFLASNAMVRSTQAAGRLALKLWMKSSPNIWHSMASKAKSTPTAPYGPPEGGGREPSPLALAEDSGNSQSGRNNCT